VRHPNAPVSYWSVCSFLRGMLIDQPSNFASGLRSPPLFSNGRPSPANRRIDSLSGPLLICLDRSFAGHRSRARNGQESSTYRQQDCLTSCRSCPASSASALPNHTRVTDPKNRRRQYRRRASTARPPALRRTMVPRKPFHARAAFHQLLVPAAW